MYSAVSNKADFPAVEAEILKYWKEAGVFEKSLDKSRCDGEFIFYDGPPFATGLPHYGHLLAGTIKDIVPRYQAMKGKYVERRFGWDCHGLPVEYEVEQDLEISGKTDIEKMGVDVFNEKCRGIVLRYTSEWRDVVTRMGRWVDFDNDYKTMEPRYMESIWWVFKSLWDKGLIYEGSKILPYCPRCSTPLSNFETNQGYEEVTDPAITVKFDLTDEEGAAILAWTTTPWTLPSNMGLAVGAEIEYARVVEKSAVYYMARARMGEFYKSEDDYESVSYLKGSELAGRTYAPLFPYFAGLSKEGAFRIAAADFVSTEDGTGVVHVAPGFGEDDHALGAREGFPVVCPVDDEGKFTAEVPDYQGREVKEADGDIIKRLKAEGKLIHRSTLVHSYPHCWRCDKPLIYRAISTWFVAVEKIKDRLIEANRQVRWVPAHIQEGRFGKWLEGARDWAISRNRYWGTPLPVWVSEDGEERVCIGSIEELEKLSGIKVDDLHKHFVDNIEIPSQQGKGKLKRIPEVLDCWFESGSMPYAQAHYPFENRDHFEKNFPADFIAEGLDQTRGWFYTLMVLSVALFDRPAFRNVIVNGMILAEDGRKMSKRLKNYPDPVYMLDTYGADALRLYMMSSPVVRAEDLCFSEEGVKHLVRHILIPLWNSYSFFVTYANIDGWTSEKACSEESDVLLDRWVLSALESLCEKVSTAMDSYDLQGSVRPFLVFIDQLTNWYIRRSRRRFWKSQDDEDKMQAYTTLHHVLLKFAKVVAPFIPMAAESIYRNLRSDDMEESVHLCRFPEADGKLRDPDLEQKMDYIMTIVKMGRQLRSDNNLKVRQPLSTIHVVCRDKKVRDAALEMKGIVLEELNVKELVVGERETEMAHLSAKANFKNLGPRFGKAVGKAAKIIGGLSEDEVETLAQGGTVSIEIDGSTEDLGAGDVVIERTPRKDMVVAAEGDVVVAIETQLTAGLIDEGLAREFVNKVQNMRKTAGFEVSDRIQITYSSDEDVVRAINAHSEYISAETLSVACTDMQNGAGMQQWDLNGHACEIAVTKAG